MNQILLSQDVGVFLSNCKCKAEFVSADFFLLQSDFLQEKGMQTTVNRTGWLSGVEERCSLSRFSWVSVSPCTCLSVKVYSLVNTRMQKFHYKEKLCAGSPGDWRSHFSAVLSVAERALPWC